MYQLFVVTETGAAGGGGGAVTTILKVQVVVVIPSFNCTDSRQDLAIVLRVGDIVMAVCSTSVKSANAGYAELPPSINIFVIVYPELGSTIIGRGQGAVYSYSTVTSGRALPTIPQNEGAVLATPVRVKVAFIVWQSCNFPSIITEQVSAPSTEPVGITISPVAAVIVTPFAGPIKLDKVYEYTGLVDDNLVAVKGVIGNVIEFYSTIKVKALVD
ncbi:hypothetical protein FGO68_gene16701 [Halteria grandinella]|uniref:Uncharacterized protein n=1 Tax=Halteria grandinella TaxID=5974 RepID=A0A8J8P652_HALGN|nr:hypothetical protein FGO68_gene16701 [Halteria grandinella]